MEDVRLLLQQMYRRFGMLNKSCCTVGSHEVSLIQSQILYEINRLHEPSVSCSQGVVEKSPLLIEHFAKELAALSGSWSKFGDL